MNVESAKKILLDGKLSVKKESRLKNESGTQLRLDSGQTINIFDNGTISFQGNGVEPIKKLFGEAHASEIPKLSNKVFVVYGHDTTAREQLDLMLRKWGLDPIILDQLPSEGKTIIEKLENYTENVGFAVVLATPDDEGHRQGRPDEKTYRARQNVVLELGMMLSLLDRSRVAILIKNPETMERPSDIHGLIYIPFKDHVKDAQIQLAKEMNAQGYQINVEKFL